MTPETLKDGSSGKSYPEIIPSQFHSAVLYRDADDLAHKLIYLLTHYTESQDLRRRLSSEMGKFAWPNLIERYDAELDRLVELRNGSYSRIN